MTAMTMPLTINETVLLPLNEQSRTDRHLGGRDFEKLSCDGSLSHLVVFECEILDKLLSVIGSVFHRHHAGTMLRSPRIKDHLEDLVLNVIGKHNVQHCFFVRLEYVSYHGIVSPLCRGAAFVWQQFKFSDRQQSPQDRTLIDGVHKMSVKHRDLVYFSFHNFLCAKLGDRFGFYKRRRVL